jgi:hypothetical protein
MYLSYDVGGGVLGAGGENREDIGNVKRRRVH